MATMLGLVMFAIVTAADGTGTTSAGSCYNMTTHAVSCNTAEVDCSSPHMWYGPGYVSPRSGCCHCEASCANTSGNCTYYDAVEDPQENWGCYEHAARQCDCLVSEAGCTAKGTGHTWTSGCTSCASQGSCYDMTSHGISCDVPETSCSPPNMWYSPGYVSPRSGCCHCRASCKEPADNCTYSDTVEDPQENWGCYEHAARQCDCLVSEAGCAAKGTGHTWTSGCTSCASQGSCYDMTSHEISCDVPETSCSSPNMWYAPGYVSPRSGCCHCRASCKEPADNCTYSDAEAQTQRNWGCYDSSTNACDCDTTEAECSGSWTQSCRSCNGEVSTSSAGRPRGFVIALLVLLYSFFAAEANTGTGTGCYNVETHKCDCAVSESTCHARGDTWTDTCRSCDSTTNEQHPDCQRQYSWGCFDEASHACQCTVSERACDAAAGKTWTHECWSCCHGSAWGCFVPGNGPESGCHCNLHETSCSLDFPDATWSHQCFDCDVDAETSAAGRPTGFVVALLVLLSGFLLADANTGTGTGCYDVETHRCDCTVTETECLARQGHWTDTCRSCDSTTNEQHPDCQRQYSWGCFDEASHACQCTVSERACDAAAGKTWTHECWSCCHGSAWGCFVPGNGPESGCHCNLYEGACALDFPDATWSHQCFECEEDSVQKDAEAAMDDGGVGVAIAVSVSVTVVVIAAFIGIYCLWAKMRQPKPVNEPYNSPQFNQSDVVVGLAVPGSAPSPGPATPKELA